MDWTKAIAINQRALLGILQEILALMDHVLEEGAARLPRVFHSAVLRQLRPAEAALRRLILVMARDVKVKLPPRRPMPRGLKLKPKPQGPVAFRLHDARKRLPVPARPHTRPTSGPRVHFFAPSPLVPLSHVIAKLQPAAPKGSVSATRLRQRVAAFRVALDNLPREARRMARWRARRHMMAQPKFTSPLRPGPPPGHTRHRRFKVDRVLEACHGLAFGALQVNSS